MVLDAYEHDDVCRGEQVEVLSAVLSAVTLVINRPR